MKWVLLVLFSASCLAYEVSLPPPYPNGVVPVPIAELAAMKMRNEILLAQNAELQDAADTLKGERDEALDRLHHMCELVHEARMKQARFR